MKRYWFKTYVEDVFSKQRMQLPDWLFRRLIEFEAFAADFGEDGLLPPVADMAWILRPVDETKLSEALMALSQVGEVEQTSDGWRLTHFAKKQAALSDADRQRMSRQRHKGVTKRDDYATEGVTGSSSSESNSPLDSESEEGGGVGEGDPIPQTPAQALQHPDIQAYQSICGRIPGVRDYAIVIETIRLLRAKHGEKLVETVKPYWLAWSSRRTKNGQPYDPASLVWLGEWAVNGQIPRANGKEPTSGENREKYVGGEYGDFVQH